MGNVYAELTLRNADDLTLAKKGYITNENVREETVNALVDTGAWTLVVNGEIQEKLGLEVQGDDSVTLANGVTQSVKITGPVQVQWKDRKMICQPILIPEADEVLLGAIPLEDMNLIVDPRNEIVVGRKKLRRL